jgi:hypothetical protein
MHCASVYLRMHLLASHVVLDSCKANREAQVLAQHVVEVGLVGAPLQGVLCSSESEQSCSTQGKVSSVCVYMPQVVCTEAAAS